MKEGTTKLKFDGPKNTKASLFFGSLNELADYVSVTPSAIPNFACSAITNPYSFTGTNSLDEALELARNGWHEGEAHVEKLTEALWDKLAEHITRPDTYWETTGISFDVGAVISGQPECWFDLRESQETVDLGISSQRNLVKIGVSLATSAGVSTNVIMARGAAVLALVQLLEYTGTRCEVDATEFAFTGCTVTTRLKSYDQPVDIPAMAFGLMHPSMLRRLMFRCLGTTPNGPVIAALGWGGEAEQNSVPEGTIALSGMYLDSIQWSNPKAAQAWILKTAEEQGVKLTK